MSSEREVLLELFDEYAAAYAAGARPDVLAFLERAGAEAEAFERLVDAYLQSAPLQAADVVEAALIDARLDEEPALLALRKRLTLSVDEVSARLAASLGLSRGVLERLQGRYQELEAGLLDPAGVSERVWLGLRAVFGVDVRALAVLVPLPPAAAPSFARLTERADWAKELDATQGDALAGTAAEPDEAAIVDELFGVA